MSLTTTGKSKILEELKKIRMKPKITAQDQMTLENQFRTYIQENYSMQDEVENGLLALIKSIFPSLSSNWIKVTSRIILKDLVGYIKSHPNLFQETMNLDEKTDRTIALDHYCDLLASSKLPIGKMEFRILSEILQIPIYIYSYRSCHTFGKKFPKAGIHLYHDPLRSLYFPMSEKIAA